MNKQTLACTTLLLLSAVAGAEDGGPAATPYRPSVSIPAAMPVPGWLDVEFGLARSEGGGDKRRQSLPVAAKLAFTPEWGLVVGSELGVRRTDAGGAVYTGQGDLTVLAKRYIAGASEGTAWGIAAGFKLPTAKDSIGSDKSDAILTGIYSADWAGGNHVDANLGVVRLGAYGSGEGRQQYGWAAAFAHALDERWSVFVEPSGTYRSGAASTGQVMLGASYAADKRVVFDIAVSKRVTQAGPDWQVLAGVTVLLARLW